MRKKKANDMNDMEIKKGDMVRVSSRLPRIYERFGSMIAPHYECKVVEIDDGMALLDSIPAKHIFLFPLKYLVKVEAEAKEPKFKKGDRVKYIGKEHPEYWGEIFTVDGEIFYNDYHKNMQIDSIRCKKYNLCNVPLSDLEPYTEPKEQAETDTDALGEFTPIPRSDNPIIGFEQAYWRKYEADLAREIAVKSMEKSYGCDPERIADYAVSVAKAVVEGLKRK